MGKPMWMSQSKLFLAGLLGLFKKEKSIAQMEEDVRLAINKTDLTPREERVIALRYGVTVDPNAELETKWGDDYLSAAFTTQLRLRIMEAKVMQAAARRNQRNGRLHIKKVRRYRPEDGRKKNKPRG